MQGGTAGMSHPGGATHRQPRWCLAMLHAEGTPTVSEGSQPVTEMGLSCRVYDVQAAAKERAASC